MRLGKEIIGRTLVGLACRLGTVKALEFFKFVDQNAGLNEEQKKLIMQGWLAIDCLPGDATLEASQLHKCLEELRQAWLKIAELEKDKGTHA